MAGENLPPSDRQMKKPVAPKENCRVRRRDRGHYPRPPATVSNARVDMPQTPFGKSAA